MRRWMCAWSVCVLLAGAGAAFAGGVHMRALDPPALSVRVEAGAAANPAGGNITFRDTVLKFDAPEIRTHTIRAKAPRNYANWFDPWQPWPGRGRDGKACCVVLKPQVDTLLLGGLYRAVIPGGVAVKSADGAKTFVMDQDYKFNRDWGQVANLNGGLGTPHEADLVITYKYAAQRIDLVQVSADGGVSVKKGKPEVTCPQLPEPDRGAAPLAGIYIANYPQPDKYVIAGKDIYPIDPKPPVAPINRDALAGTRAKLAAGKTVTIAFLGASTTLGAEAGQWWKDRSLTYTGRTVAGIKKMYPRAAIREIAAYRGGITAKTGLQYMRDKVIPKKPDLILIRFGGNDAGSAIGKPPRNPPEEFKKDIRALIRQAKEAGMEVLLVSQTPPHPAFQTAGRMPAYRDAKEELAREEKVGMADVFTEWQNMAARGTPPWTQLHNFHNHPGREGHKLFADVILRFFK